MMNAGQLIHDTHAAAQLSTCALLAAGGFPDAVARVCQLIDENCPNVDWVDINMGCPIDIVSGRCAAFHVSGSAPVGAPPSLLLHTLHATTHLMPALMLHTSTAS
jgi:hypothetical protein